MKKIYLSVLSFILLFPLRLFAKSRSVKELFNSGLKETGEKTGHAGSEITKAGALGGVGFVLKILLSLSGAIFLGLMIYSGFIWMNARGNDSEVSKAKDTIRNCIIGLLIVMSAYAITSFVGNSIMSAVK